MQRDGYCECGCGLATRIARTSDDRDGTVKGQPYRFVRGHHLRGRRLPEHTRQAIGNAQRGPRNHHWSGGVKSGNGYARVLQPEHPHADACGRVLRSHLVIEKVIGRYVLPTEEVHHINRDTLDDRPENLQVLTCSEHAAIHAPEGGAKGERNRSAKLTELQVLHIRSLVLEGLSDKAIASMFGISPSTVYAIKTRTIWRHIPEAQNASA